MKYNRKYAAVLSLLFIVNIIGNTACGNTSAETGHVSIADMAMENTGLSCSVKQDTPTGARK